MSRTGIPSGYATELAGKVLRRFWFMRLELDAATYAYHNGPKGRTYTVDSVDYVNTGIWLDDVVQVDERLSNNGGIPGAAIELAALVDLVDDLRAGPVHNAPCELMWALCDEGWGLLGGVDPCSVGVFKVASAAGRYLRGGRVRIELDPPAAVGRRMAAVVGSNACQQQRFTGDTGWDYAHRFQDAVLNWGGQVLRTGGAGGGIGGMAGSSVNLPGSFSFGPDNERAAITTTGYPG